LNYWQIPLLWWESLDPGSQTDILNLVIVVVTAIVSVYLIRRQLRQNEEAIRENTKERELQALVYLFDSISNKERRQARKYVLLELGNKSWKTLKRDDQDRLIDVWDSYDNLALLVKEDYLRKDVVVKMWGKGIKSCYERSKRQLDEFRLERVKKMKGALEEGEAKEYMKYFEELAKSL
jgi:hypothetical protein